MAMPDTHCLNGMIWLSTLCLSLLPLNAHATEDTDHARGAYLARAADCTACHTQPGEASYAGGLTIQSPMGSIPASNITPDLDTGIGAYSEIDFAHALRDGVRRDGAHLYPAMPYTAYAGLSDQDLHDLYRYFMHDVAPVHHKVAPPDLMFPFNLRGLMAPWNLLFLSHAHPAVEIDNSALARGRYLVDHLEHCGVCHTPRNALMAEKTGRYLSGAALGGWYAPNITSSEDSGIGLWRTEELVQYLKTGNIPGKAQAVGPMGEAVEHSLSHLNDADLYAIAVWLKQVPAIQTSPQPMSRSSRGHPMPALDLQPGQPVAMNAVLPRDGQSLYRGNCASCHGIGGNGTSDRYVPSLHHNSTVGASNRNNLIMVILNGVNQTIGDTHISMPRFGPGSGANALSDHEIAILVNYLTSTFGDGQRSMTAEEVKSVREGGPTPLLVSLMLWARRAAIPILLLAIVVGVLLYRRAQHDRRR